MFFIFPHKKIETPDDLAPGKELTIRCRKQNKKVKISYQTLKNWNTITQYYPTNAIKTYCDKGAGR